MDLSNDVADSTDWLATSTPLLAPFESSLRCQVCKDLYNTPMITSCAHTFCSLCIRRCLDNDGKCPACRESDQPSKLRKNWAVQNIVDLFQEARAQVLDVAREHRLRREEQAGDASGGAGGKRKRKWVDVEDGGQAQGSQKSARQTRSQTQRTSKPVGSQDAVVMESDGDEEYLPGSSPQQPAEKPNDGMVACPMCNTRMKEEGMWSHLDKCDGTPPKQKVLSRSITPQSKAASFPPPQASNNITRLSQPNFAMMKDMALKRRMTELGIPVWGDRQLLMKRYTEWVNLFNSNADSSRPRSIRELLRDLETWERSQGGRASQREVKTKDKDFDGHVWARENKDQFTDLIAQAKAKRKTTTSAGTPGVADGISMKGEASNGDEGLKAVALASRAGNSVVVRRSSDQVTASVDPLIAEVSQGASAQDSHEEPSSGMQVDDEGTAMDLIPTQHESSTLEMEHPKPPSNAIMQLSESPIEKRPMFTLPEAGFTDGDGIESGGQ